MYEQEIVVSAYESTCQRAAYARQSRLTQRGHRLLCTRIGGIQCSVKLSDIESTSPQSIQAEYNNWINRMSPVCVRCTELIGLSQLTIESIEVRIPNRSHKRDPPCGVKVTTRSENTLESRSRQRSSFSRSDRRTDREERDAIKSIRCITRRILVEKLNSCRV